MPVESPLAVVCAERVTVCTTDIHCRSTPDVFVDILAYCGALAAAGPTSTSICSSTLSLRVQTPKQESGAQATITGRKRDSS